MYTCYFFLSVFPKKQKPANANFMYIREKNKKQIAINSTSNKTEPYTFEDNHLSIRTLPLLAYNNESVFRGT